MGATSGADPQALPVVCYSINGTSAGKSLAAINAPSETFFFGDGVWASADAGNLTRLTRAARHSEGLNYAFIDGHVKWTQASKVTAIIWGP